MIKEYLLDLDSAKLAENIRQWSINISNVKQVQLRDEEEIE